MLTPEIAAEGGYYFNHLPQGWFFQFVRGLHA